MAAPTLRFTADDGSTREFVLQPGCNSLGRREGNTHVIDLPSVSGHHCDVLYEAGTLSVLDQGSTNGTFLDGERVTESALLPGQTLRLGSVDLVLIADSPPAADPPRPVVRVAPPAAPRLSGAPVGSAAPRVARMGPPTPLPPGTFFQRLPGAFAYPISLNGIMLLIGGAILFGILGFYSGFSFILSGIAGGYLFAYVQKMVASSAQGEREMPDYLEFSEWWSDIILPLFTFVGTFLLCLGPAILLYTLGDKSNLAVLYGALALLCLGGFFFPMALLMVCVTDSLLSLNPALVIVSIGRIIGPYLVACLVLALLVGLRMLAEIALSLASIPLLSSAVTSFVGLYFLAVEARIIGLLYYTNRARLAWFS